MRSSPRSLWAAVGLAPCLVLLACSLDDISNGVRPPIAADSGAEAGPGPDDGGGETSGGDPCPGCEIIASEEHPTELVIFEGRLAWLRSITEGRVVTSDLDGKAVDDESSYPAIASPHDLVAVEDGFFVLSGNGNMTRRFSYSTCVDDDGIDRLAAFGTSLLMVKPTGLLRGECGGQTPLVSDSVTAVAGDAPYAWYARAGGDIVRCDASSNQCESTRKVLATGQGNVDTIVVDATRVFWITRGATSEIRTRLKAAVDAPGSADVVGSGQPKTLAPAGDHLYWTDIEAGAVLRAASAGRGSATSVARGLNQPWGIALSPTHLYFSESAAGRIQRMPR